MGVGRQGYEDQPRQTGHATLPRAHRGRPDQRGTHGLDRAWRPIPVAGGHPRQESRTAGAKDADAQAADSDRRRPTAAELERREPRPRITSMPPPITPTT